MAAPTSALTFQDLIIEVAKFLGVANYGAGGDEAAQLPIDAHNLDLCKTIVNKGIRKFFNDAPVTGWNFAQVVQDFTIFNDVTADSSKTVNAGAYDSGNDETTLTASSDVFYPGMEYLNIVTTTTGTFRIKSYESATQIKVIGDASAVSAETYSITTEGNFTLPPNFGGSFTGDITYVEETNQGVTIKWIHEATIRRWREDITNEIGDPYWAAIRPHPTEAARNARRWQLMTYPQPDETMMVQFPYTIHFDKLVNNTDNPPVPYHHDETIRQACLAIAERDEEDAATVHHQTEYDRCLQRSYAIDNRSGPRRLGYFGNPTGPVSGSVIQTFRDHIYDRPNVTYNTD